MRDSHSYGAPPIFERAVVARVPRRRLSRPLPLKGGGVLPIVGEAANYVVTLIRPSTAIVGAGPPVLARAGRRRRDRPAGSPSVLLRSRPQRSPLLSRLLNGSLIDPALGGRTHPEPHPLNGLGTVCPVASSELFVSSFAWVIRRASRAALRRPSARRSRCENGRWSCIIDILLSIGAGNEVSIARRFVCFSLGICRRARRADRHSDDGPIEHGLSHNHRVRRRKVSLGSGEECAVMELEFCRWAYRNRVHAAQG
jgi:hypothetical protein